MLTRRLRREFKERSYQLVETPLTTRILFDHQEHRIIMDLPPDYPFKVPTSLFINGVKMNHRYFYDRPKAVIDELSLHGCCFMCQSFLCGDNWSPSRTLDHIVCQMIEYRASILQAHYNVYIRTSSMLPLPDDLVDKTLDYL